MPPVVSSTNTSRAKGRSACDYSDESCYLCAPAGFNRDKVYRWRNKRKAEAGDAATQDIIDHASGRPSILNPAGRNNLGSQQPVTNTTSTSSAIGELPQSLSRSSLYRSRLREEAAAGGRGGQAAQAILDRQAARSRERMANARKSNLENSEAPQQADSLGAPGDYQLTKEEHEISEETGRMLTGEDADSIDRFFAGFGGD